MRSEHLSNLHPGWTLIGWLVAVAVAAVVQIALVGSGLLPPVGGAAALGSMVALAVGFFAGGLFVGLRWSDAPILHGVALALVSALVWFAGALLAPDAVGGRMGEGDTAVLGSLLLQLAAAVAGALTGRSLVRSGHTPDPAAMPPEA